MSRRACDSCKQRKVKCDQQLPPPCTPCRVSRESCTYIVPLRKRGPKPRPRATQDQPASAARQQLAQPSRPYDIDTARLQSSPSFPATNAACTLTDASSSSRPFEAETLDTEAMSLPLLCHLKLTASLSLAAGDGHPGRLVKRSINAFMETGFALVPIVYEPALRSQACLTLPPFAGRLGSPLENVTPEMLDRIQNYCMITALGAISHCMPGKTPAGDGLATLFLNASEATLHTYAKHEMSRPNSSSLAARIFLASCHHLMGDYNLAWHFTDEAVRLAIQMRLFDEHSYSDLSSTEAALRRNIFWHLYSSDKSAHLLNGRPLQLDELHLETPFTTVFSLSQAPLLLDQSRLENNGRFEEMLSKGFHKDHQVWKLGHTVLSELRLLIALTHRMGETVEINQNLLRSLSESYLQFLAVLDDMPECIMSPTTVFGHDDRCTGYQRQAFWVQKTNVTLTYHYLRLVMLDRFITADFPHILGLSDDPVSLAWKKVEIAHDVLNMVVAVPFEALQANGEPCVEKLRYVCATLLEAIQNNESVPVTTRARSHFKALLDCLSMLNSRVSEKLAENILMGDHAGESQVEQ